MKLDMDCVRDVLLAIEGAGFYEHLNVEWLEKQLPDYSHEDIWYTCLKLEEGELLELEAVLYKPPLPEIKSITGLTYKGHEFLANIQSNTVWTKTKTVIEKIGTKSVEAAVHIASNVITELIKVELGLM